MAKPRTKIKHVYKKEKHKLDLQLKNYDEKHQEIIYKQHITSRSVSQSWVDYKEIIK